jgi:hypothetical protein
MGSLSPTNRPSQQPSLSENLSPKVSAVVILSPIVILNKTTETTRTSLFSEKSPEQSCMREDSPFTSSSQRSPRDFAFPSTPKRAVSMPTWGDIMIDDIID